MLYVAQACLLCDKNACFEHADARLAITLMQRIETSALPAAAARARAAVQADGGRVQGQAAGGGGGQARSLRGRGGCGQAGHREPAGQGGGGHQAAPRQHQPRQALAR